MGGFLTFWATFTNLSKRNASYEIKIQILFYKHWISLYELVCQFIWVNYKKHSRRLVQRYWKKTMQVSMIFMWYKLPMLNGIVHTKMCQNKSHGFSTWGPRTFAKISLMYIVMVYYWLTFLEMSIIGRKVNNLIRHIVLKITQAEFPIF